MSTDIKNLAAADQPDAWMNTEKGTDAIAEIMRRPQGEVEGTSTTAVEVRPERPAITRSDPDAALNLTEAADEIARVNRQEAPQAPAQRAPVEQPRAFSSDAMRAQGQDAAQQWFADRDQYNTEFAQVPWAFLEQNDKEQHEAAKQHFSARHAELLASGQQIDQLSQQYNQGIAQTQHEQARQQNLVAKVLAFADATGFERYRDPAERASVLRFAVEKLGWDQRQLEDADMSVWRDVDRQYVASRRRTVRVPKAKKKAATDNRPTHQVKAEKYMRKHHVQRGGLQEAATRISHILGNDKGI